MSADLRRLYTPTRSTNQPRFSRVRSGAELIGFDDLYKQMAVNLPRATSLVVLRRTGVHAMEPMFERAKELAHVHSGKTRGSITLTAKALRATARFGNAIRIQIGAGGGDVFWPKFEEHGTVNMPAVPFMRPAFDNEHAQVVERLKLLLRVEVANAIARRAKRLAKRAGG